MALFNLLAGMYLKHLHVLLFIFVHNFAEVMFKLGDYSSRTDAEEALQGLHGSLIGKQAVRLSWGRSPSHKQVCHA